jgi:superfamily II DNA/RNA helicase
MYRSSCYGKSLPGDFESTDIIQLQGCDFPDCSRVIQFLVTDDFDSWIQRGGRGGRGGGEFCRSTILVQPSVTTVINKRKHSSGTSEEREVIYQKRVGESFRRFLTSTDVCLWDIIDQHYGNPIRYGELLSFIRSLQH